MNIFEVPQWENDVTGDTLEDVFKFGSSKRKKKKNIEKLASLVGSDASVSNKKKVKNGLLKKLVNLKNKPAYKECNKAQQYESSSKKMKGKNLLKSSKANDIMHLESKLEYVKQETVTAPISGDIKKQKKKKRRRKKMTKEDSTLYSENSLISLQDVKEKLSHPKVSEPNTTKNAPKKRKRLCSESSVPLLKSKAFSSEEISTNPKQKKLKLENDTNMEDTSMSIIESQKSPYNILKLKEIFATTPPSEVKKKKKVATTLREKMMQRLQASRFRYLNEQLYTSEPKDAQELFRSDPEAFEAYHEGYQQQVHRWPINPLDVIIKSLKKKPAELKIADFGCGDAQLARSLPNKVHSFDLVALSDEVIACNMAHTPLSSASVDVVVFCLSLMGTSLREFLLEANRVLKEGGLMKIAEVESRFDNVEEFIAKLQKFGFACTWKDFSHNLFYFLDFKKERCISKKMKKKLPELTLKPCLYKKR